MTDIIVTLWPATQSLEKLKQLRTEGVRILRFNFPHYNQATLAKDLKNIRKVEKDIGAKFRLVLDTEGPQVRTWELQEPIKYAIGEKFRIVVDEKKRGDRDLFCDYPKLVKDAKIGMIIRIDSGLFDVEVIGKWSESLVVKALMPFTVGSRRHMNLPNLHFDLPTLSAKDYEDIHFAIKNKFDYIAISFTRNADDIRELRNFFKKNNAKKIGIISKIENQEGIDSIEEIIKESDMLMIARWDLGIELPVEKIPLYQIELIKKCKKKKLPVIVATQMLESMINYPIPTRAEVSDIFYAVLEGANYVMLSWETAIGKYPIECVKVMQRVIKQAKII